MSRTAFTKIAHETSKETAVAMAIAKGVSPTQVELWSLSVK